MKTLNPLKVPFGTGKGVALRGVRYLQWEDAFEVDFIDGLTFLEPHATIRKANKISNGAKPVRVAQNGSNMKACRQEFFARNTSSQSLRALVAPKISRALSKCWIR